MSFYPNKSYPFSSANCDRQGVSRVEIQQSKKTNNTLILSWFLLDDLSQSRTFETKHICDKLI